MKREIKFFILFIALFPAFSAGYSQVMKGSVRKYIREADFELYNNNFQKAFELYQKAYALDTTDPKAALKLGICMYSIRQYKLQSLPYFERAEKKNFQEVNYYLGNLYHLNGRFQDAIQAFQNYRNISGKKDFSNEEVDFLINKCKTAIEFKQAPVNVTIKNIGRTVNSAYPDYVPLISADESVLIFTSRRPGSTGNLLDPFGDYFEDVYISTKNDSGWTAPRSISSNINTSTHDACVGLSADGELLFLYRTGEDMLSGDLYSSVFNGKDWTVPAKLPAPINSAEYTEPSIAMSSDGQTIYFSSNRPGGYGKKDIYKVIRLPDGDWSKPLNMGPSINTAEDEDALFIHPDAKTFYFSSKGHKNMGGYDIFKTTLGEDGRWSEAENLGYPINTPDDDVFFVLSTDGKTGYYSSVQPDSYGATDIYLVNFPDEDFGLAVFKGMVLSDGSPEQPITAKISLYDTGLKKLIGSYTTNSLTGKFIMIIKPGKGYIIKVDADGYESYIEQINPLGSEESEKIKLRRTEK